MEELKRIVKKNCILLYHDVCFSLIDLREVGNNDDSDLLEKNSIDGW